MSLSRKPNVTLFSCKKRQRDSEKMQTFVGIKESPFAGKTFSSESIFVKIFVVLVP